MDRREILNGLFGLIAAAGVASIIGASTADADYKTALFWGGVAGAAVGTLGIIILLVLPRRSASAVEQPPIIQEGGISTTNQSGGTNTQNFNL